MDPIFLYRSSDGERFTRQANGKYSMDNSRMEPKYEYPLEVLSSPDFVDSKEKCLLEPVVSESDGHGNGDFDE
jgi:hypothetical protein